MAWVKKVIAAAGALAALGAVGIWQGAAHDAFTAVPWRELPDASVPLWAAVSLAIGGGIVGALAMALRRRAAVPTDDRATTLEAALDDASIMLDLDASLFLLAPWLIVSPDPDKAPKEIADDFVEDCRRLFKQQVRRVSIFRPTDDGDYLVPWAAPELPQASWERTRCYIGAALAPGQPRGTAGEAFVSGALQIGRMSKDDAGAWVCSNPHYINFDRPERIPQYAAFAAVPLLGLQAEVIGVLCLDSTDPTIFDSEDSRGVLLMLADRAGAILALHRAIADDRAGRKPPENRPSGR